MLRNKILGTPWTPAEDELLLKGLQEFGTGQVFFLERISSTFKKVAFLTRSIYCFSKNAS